MAKDKSYNFDKVTPEMKGGLTFWSKFLDMGSANIRTAIRQEKLEGTLEAPNPEKPEHKQWMITGEQIMAWRESVGTRTSSGTKAAGPKGYKYKFANSMLPEQVIQVQNALALATFDFPVEIVRATKAKAKAEGENEASTDTIVEPLASPEPAPAPKVKRGFGR